MGSTSKAVQASGVTAPSVSLDERVRTRTDYESRWRFWRTDPLNGKKGWSKGLFYEKPNRSYLDDEYDHGFDLQPDKDGKTTEYYHRDYFGRVTWRPRDVIRYISPNNGVPSRLIVQATPSVRAKNPAGNWRRTSLTGQVPFVFKLSEWALSPSDPRPDERRRFFGILDSFCRILLIAPVLLFMLSLPLDQAWVNSEFQDNYKQFPNYFWDYPKYARNKMDMRPFSSPEGRQALENQNMKDVSYKVRLVRPRQLMVLKGGKWYLDPNPHQRVSYIFISWTSRHFKA